MVGGRTRTTSDAHCPSGSESKVYSCRLDAHQRRDKIACVRDHHPGSNLLLPSPSKTTLAPQRTTDVRRHCQALSTGLKLRSTSFPLNNWRQRIFSPMQNVLPFLPWQYTRFEVVTTSSTLFSVTAHPGYNTKLQIMVTRVYDMYIWATEHILVKQAGITQHHPSHVQHGPTQHS